jgi:anti-sigma regulatory factor (Ser/Thr protein kinase)
MRETITALLLGWSRAFPATPENVRKARHFLATILDGRPAADDAIACLSELVTNAATHSDSRLPNGRFTVHTQVQGNHLRVSVTDEGGPWAQVPSPVGDEEHGRGLLIVAQLADRWGRTGDSDAGWTVWFEITGQSVLPAQPLRAVR